MIIKPQLCVSLLIAISAVGVVMANGEECSQFAAIVSDEGALAEAKKLLDAKTDLPST